MKGWSLVVCVRRIKYYPYTLMETTVPRLVQDPLAVLLLDNRLYNTTNTRTSILVNLTPDVIIDMVKLTCRATEFRLIPACPLDVKARRMDEALLNA